MATPSPSAAEIQARVLYRDKLLLVLDKPAGLAVHRGPKTTESLEQLLPDLQFGYKELPQLGHRLDRDTSGCLVLGRNRRALRRLGTLFAEMRGVQPIKPDRDGGDGLEEQAA